MNKPARISRPSSPDTLPKSNSNKKTNQRKPLKEFNGSAVSIEAPKGCFRFLLSNSSSKTTLPRSKSLPKTPKSTPQTRALPYKCGTPHSQTRSRRSNQARAAPKQPSENGTKPNSEPQVRDSDSECLKQTHGNGIVPSSQAKPRGKDPQYKDRRGSPAIAGEENDTGKALDLNFRAVLENQTPANKLVSGLSLISTPDKGSEQLTPPVEASISPEIHCISEANCTPACFGAGHVVARVTDKRRCRPRGILTVGDGNQDLGFAEDCKIRVSVVPDPAEASVQWLVSPSDAKGAPKNGSPDFGAVPFSPEGDPELGLLCFGPKGEILEPKTSCTVFEGVPHTPKGILRKESPCSFVSEATVSSGFGISQSRKHRNMCVGLDEEPYSPRSGLQNLGPCPFVSEGTPSSGAGFSDYCIKGSDMDSQTVTAKLCVLLRKEAKATGYDGRFGYHHRYDLANNNSPFSGGSSTSGNVICTPTSGSTFDRELNFRLEMGELSDPQFDLGSIGEVLRTMNSPLENQMAALPLPALDFQFPCPTAPSNSADETQFEKQFLCSNLNGFGSIELCRLERETPSPTFSDMSQMRISWREGLVSRIFEMDELDCCEWLSQEEEEVDYCENYRAKPNFNHDFDQNMQSLTLADKYLQSSDAFGSFEFVCEEQVHRNGGEVKHPLLRPISCAESISTEGGGLVDSGDSDWSICYKNQLFEESA